MADIYNPILKCGDSDFASPWQPTVVLPPNRFNPIPVREALFGCGKAIQEGQEFTKIDGRYFCAGCSGKLRKIADRVKTA